VRIQLILKAILSTILLPGLAIVLVPYLLLARSGGTVWPSLAVLPVFSFILCFLATGTLIHCIWGFAVHGKGTLTPLDPPEVLVIRGAYRYTRNPMYTAVVIALLSEAMFFASAAILIWAVLAFALFHLFVLLYEEPHLRRQFGTAYEEYCRGVPRWGIRPRPFTPSEAAS
jgi:protein-S-isoprenylcysteine O-methyltransferase Ste14